MKLFFYYIVIFVACSNFCAAQQTAIVNVSVIDVEKGNTVPAQTVIIEDDRIIYVGPKKKLSQKTKIINATGKYLIPGLVDFNAGVLEYEYKNEAALLLMLAHGVTTVRNLQPTMDAAFGRKLKTEIEKGNRMGPRLLLVSPLITTRSRREGKMVVQTIAEGIAAVDTVVAQGADLIKLDNTLAPDVLKAVVQRAHHYNKKVIGGWTTPFTEAAEAGVDAIDHVSDLRRTTTINREVYFHFYRSDSNRIVPRKDFYNRVLPSLGGIDSAYFLQTIATLKKHNTALCLNMGYMPNTVKFEWGDTTRNAFRSARMKEALAKEKLEIDKLEDLPRYKSRIDLTEVKWAHDLGLKLVYGTGLYNFQTPGITVHDGFYWMQENGFTPAQILRTATINAAEFLNEEKDRGSIAKGKWADLVLLDANPLEDINNTRKIFAVLRNGKLLLRKDLDAMLQNIRNSISQSSNQSAK